MSNFRPDIVFSSKDSKESVLSKEDIAEEARILGIVPEENIGVTESGEYHRDNTDVNVKALSAAHPPEKSEVRKLLHNCFKPNPEAGRLFEMWAYTGKLGKKKNDVMDQFSHLMTIYFDTLKHKYPDQQKELSNIEAKVTVIQDELKDVMPNNKRVNDLIAPCIAGLLISML